MVTNVSLQVILLRLFHNPPLSSIAQTRLPFRWWGMLPTREGSLNAVTPCIATSTPRGEPRPEAGVQRRVGSGGGVTIASSPKHGTCACPRMPLTPIDQQSHLGDGVGDGRWHGAIGGSLGHHCPRRAPQCGGADGPPGHRTGLVHTPDMANAGLRRSHSACCL
jgi:hypothetical protein